MDAVEGISLRVGGTDRTVRIAALPSDDHEVHFAARVSGGVCKLPLTVAPMESVLLILEETTERMEEP